MKVKIWVNSQDMTKEDIRALIQLIREWELRTPRGDITSVQFETDPGITSEEAKRMFEGIFPEFEHLLEIPKSKAQLLRLGSRGLTVDGELIGTVEELSLSIGEASEEDVKKLEEAEAIALVRIGRG
ncbi:hypothetical protein LCGC14_0936350 [marine sediment metagenome]|uniref:Uncharacterized protein n=1 Tax=marine sediment metagenome TaxID=412755 RepID=A0A0F9RSW5_9ZZZZ